jgi:DNA-binding MltR family transcriptional regulator
MSNREIIPLEQLSADTVELHKAINGESNLACALICGAALEHAITTLLSRFFLEGKVAKSILTDPKGALASFGASCDVAYCLGLITKGMHDNLKKTGKIRNRFAHSHLHIGFGDSEVTKLCKSLTLPKVTQRVNQDADDPDWLEKMLESH